MTSEPDPKIIDLIQASAKEALAIEGGARFQSLEFFPPRTDTVGFPFADRQQERRTSRRAFFDTSHSFLLSSLSSSWCSPAPVLFVGPWRPKRTRWFAHFWENV